MRKNILFDLDGTLLPMDLPKFIKIYLRSFCERFVPLTGVDGDTLSTGIWNGAAAMAQNDGNYINSELFWEAMNSTCGRDMRVFKKDIDDYYTGGFASAKEAVWQSPHAAKSIELLKSRGCRLIVATNPIFPISATVTRIKWAGLDPTDFELITVYDNSSSCKPSLWYYADICAICGISPEESMMVGNDVDEDMCAAEPGFDTFLITDCLINRHEKDISKYRHGSFEEFYLWLQKEYD